LSRPRHKLFDRIGWGYFPSGREGCVVYFVVFWIPFALALGIEVAAQELFDRSLFFVTVPAMIGVTWGFHRFAKRYS